MNLLAEQRKIGWITVLSGFLALGCMIASLIAVNYNSEALSDPLLILTTAGTNASAARWSMILDLFGYYLLLLPVIYLLHDWMKEKTAWANLVTFCGLAYVLIGSIGAAILSVIWPQIMTAYPAATMDEQQILKSNFSLINDLVYGGLWNLLEMILAAVWWMGTGWLLLKNKFRFIGWLTIITGIACLGDALSGLLQLSRLHELALNVYLVMAILWAIAMGVWVIKRRLK